VNTYFQGLFNGFDSGVESTPMYEKVFYVGKYKTSNNITYFQSIQNAVDACDGITSTLIFIQHGTYIENIVLKPNVSLSGIDRNGVILQAAALGSTESVISLSTTATTITNISNLYVSCYGVNGIKIDLTGATTVSTIRIDRCIIDGDMTNNMIQIWGTTGAVYHFVSLTYNHFNISGTNGSYQVINFRYPKFWRIHGCTTDTTILSSQILVDAGDAQDAVSISNSTLPMINGIVGAASATRWFVTNTRFVSVGQAQYFNSASACFENCQWMPSQAAAATSRALIVSGSGTLFFNNCSAYGVNSTGITNTVEAAWFGDGLNVQCTNFYFYGDVMIDNAAMTHLKKSFFFCTINSGGTYSYSGSDTTVTGSQVSLMSVTTNKPIDPILSVTPDSFEWILDSTLYDFAMSGI